MNEVLDRIIKQSGAMWEEACNPGARTTSPVLIKLNVPTVFELTLPEGEHHPFWRVNERVMTDDEKAKFRIARARFPGEMGDLIGMNGDPGETSGPYMRIRAYVYNGRRAEDWDISVERVRVTIEREG